MTQLPARFRCDMCGAESLLEVSGRWIRIVERGGRNECARGDARGRPCLVALVIADA